MKYDRLRREFPRCIPLCVQQSPADFAIEFQELESCTEAGTGSSKYCLGFWTFEDGEKFAWQRSECHTTFIGHRGELLGCGKLNVVATLDKSLGKCEVGLNIASCTQRMD
ncbi:hypothetical protein SHLA_59c000040 [Shinella sp. DD12]|nr:hypothetical protein SHLA_59c000040 [Shinella sp. DD12]